MVDLFDQAIQLLNRAGLVGALVIAVYALVKEWIVPGTRYKDALKRIDELETRLDNQTRITDKAISATDVVARGRPE